MEEKSLQNIEDFGKKSPSVNVLQNGKLAISLFGVLSRFFFYPLGKFICGGPQGGAGPTGRNFLIVTFGGLFAHGGGAFSGKDLS
mmetsp:Transcript_74537/g.230357  ORF Transcript_74537/g.230357 Transcript_74537/m.230357 type:complete len:85 (-) Transcript_74537:20-274(-)